MSFPAIAFLACVQTSVCRLNLNEIVCAFVSLPFLARSFTIVQCSSLAMTPETLKVCARSWQGAWPRYWLYHSFLPIMQLAVDSEQARFSVSFYWLEGEGHPSSQFYTMTLAMVLSRLSGMSVLYHPTESKACFCSWKLM